MNVGDLWTWLTGAKSAIDYARGMTDMVKSLSELRRTGEDMLEGTPEERAARTAVAALYFEILFNIYALRMGQTVDPPGLFISHRVWDRSDHIFEHLSLLVSPAEVGLILGPYLQLDNYHRVLNGSWIDLLAIRLTGSDGSLFEGLAQSFREAEKLLRSKVLSKPQQENLEKFLKDNKILEPMPRRAFIKRLHGVIGTMPVWAPFALGLASQMVLPDSWLWRRVRALTRYLRA